MLSFYIFDATLINVATVVKTCCLNNGFSFSVTNYTSLIFRSTGSTSRTNAMLYVLQAAVKEIDIDGSGTLDFYEYLQVAMMLERKKGKLLLIIN